MSIHFVKAKGAYCFSFKRIINGKSVRTTKLLPKAWNQAQAHAYDLKETARLYAEVTGVTHSRPTIEQAILLFLEGRVHELKSKASYTEEIGAMFKFYEGKFLDELSEVCAEINKLPVKPATRRRKIAILTSACNYAYKYHKLGASKPSTNVQYPKVNNARVLHPSRKEMLQLARSTRNKQIRAVIFTAFYSGMRRSEILRVAIDGDVFKLFDTKNGSLRFVPIHRKLKPYLKEFPIRMSKNYLSQAFTRLSKKLGLDNYTLHDLRHSTASELINEGADLYTVGLLLGHKDLSSTRRYAHMLTETLNKALQRIGVQKKTDLST